MMSGGDRFGCFGILAWRWWRDYMHVELVIDVDMSIGCGMEWTKNSKIK